MTFQEDLSGFKNLNIMETFSFENGHAVYFSTSDLDCDALAFYSNLTPKIKPTILPANSKHALISLLNKANEYLKPPILLHGTRKGTLFVHSNGFPGLYSTTFVSLGNLIGGETVEIFEHNTRTTKAGVVPKVTVTQTTPFKTRLVLDKKDVCLFSQRKWSPHHTNKWRPQSPKNNAPRCDFFNAKGTRFLEITRCPDGSRRRARKRFPCHHDRSKTSERQTWL